MKILIAGDSWARGEWSLPDVKISHEGVKQYFKDSGYIVDKCSQGGSTNEIQANRIENMTENNNYNFIFWFQTDPLRQRYNDNPRLISEDSISLDHFLNIREQCIQKVYQQLDNIGVKIYCIGGCSSLSDSIEQYKNLHVAIKFIPEWLIPDREFPLTLNQQWQYNLSRKSDDKVYEFFLNDQKKYNDFWHHAVNIKDSIEHKYFYPDGEHLNRKGHYLVYQHLKTIIEEQQ